MASLKSLGIHTPVALPYLISEGLLPANAEPRDYQWESYATHGKHGPIEEEVFATRKCVVWSQGPYVRHVYRFDLEEGDVTQALLTNFPDSNKSTDATQAALSAPRQSVNGTGKVTSSGSPKTKPLGQPDVAEVDDESKSSIRALVVLLNSKAHVYFLHGTSHMVDLPFEVERAFPAPRGLVIQRKASPSPSTPPTPVMPAAPPNSFFSSQIQPTASILQSPSIVKSFASTQASHVSPQTLKLKAEMDRVLPDIFSGATEEAEENIAGLYTLTNPLSDVGVIRYSIQQQKPRLSSRNQSNTSVTFEPLDASEEVVYVSPEDELGSSVERVYEPLVIIVTVNRETSTVTTWHAWYLSEKSLSTLLKQRDAAKSAKARRRSSFISAGLATGATTPTVRNREAGARESHAGEHTVVATLETANLSRQDSARSTRRKTRQEEEEAMASQMDPDFQPSNSQQAAAAARESRRISSLNTDTRGGQHQAGNSFTAPGGRRNPSFGGFNERKSLGYRKSRGSTPGSVLSRSLGVDDDLMDLSWSSDESETVEGVIRHIKATFEAGGAEDILGATDDNFKRDIAVRKILSFPMQIARSSPEDTRSSVRVCTLSTTHSGSDRDLRKLDIYVHEGSDVTCVHVLVRSRALDPESSTTHCFPIPMVVGEKKHKSINNIIKLKHGTAEAIVMGDKGLIISPQDGQIWPLPVASRYRHYSPFGLLQDHEIDTDVGRNRTKPRSPQSVAQLTHSGINGRYDEITGDGSHHRMQLQLRPTDPLIASLIEACELVVPSLHDKTVTGTWYLACVSLQREHQRLHRTGESLECVAFVATILAFAMPSIDPKVRASLRMAIAAGVESNVTYQRSLQKTRQLTQLSKRTAWSRLMEKSPRQLTGIIHPETAAGSTQQGDQLLTSAAMLAEDILQTQQWQNLRTLSTNEIVKIMLALHVTSEEQKLCVLMSRSKSDFLAPLITQLGSWLGAPNWSHGSCSYYDLESDSRWTQVKSTSQQQLQMSFMDTPVGVYHWFEHAMNISSRERYPTLDSIARLDSNITLSKEAQETAKRITHRLAVLSDVVESTNGLTAPAIETVELMDQCGLTTDIMETLPEAIAAPFKDAMSRCEKDPPTTWSQRLLNLVGRDDLVTKDERGVSHSSSNTSKAASSPLDVQTICNALDHHTHAAKTKEASRHAVSQLIFHEDRRLVGATNLMHFNSAQVAECTKQPDWTDAQHLEQQRRVTLCATTRMIALPAGDAMIHFDSQSILLTDKYHLNGFSTSCIIQPMGHTMTIDRSGLTEEKVNWAYFHAGASAGLRISRNIEGIDTSWIAFNKPADLTNRHAGLLLALGLSGHLRQLAKWLSFKYLTPKHSVTSVGLLLGLSASYMGTMDSLITRMLSVHITRMLPPGAAELNVSPMTQTAGLVGIGLLYCNTQHRRMSEVMLSEVEHMEVEDPDAGPDPLRDESYRLAAGIALGFINLGKGKDLYGLHGMYLPERLLRVAVGPRPVSAVHVFDKATAGAVIAIAMVYMKSGDQSVARKIDIPDTEAQFDHVRPDMLMLRAMAKHLILWDAIEVRQAKTGTPSWIQTNLPSCYRTRIEDIRASSGRHPLKSSDVPFFNVATGLALALSLRYAGSGNTDARDEILSLLDDFYMVKRGAEAHYYDAKLTRSTVRRCIDVLALAAATVMAGTGDVRTFRYLRRLHGRTDAETPYGSHFAAHLAIGTLFLGGGTFTLGTSDLAIASLIVAFYPLYPMDVHDNHVHLQALRHFWVFAVESRCLVVEETDTKRPISMPIIVMLKDGSTRSMTAPCLLPELDTIATIHTNNPAYWRATLDFQNNPEHIASFRHSQRIFVRRCPALEAHSSIFSATLAALSAVQSSTRSTQQMWQSIFELDAFKELDKSSIGLILPPDVNSAVSNDEKGTVVDDKLVLTKAVDSSDRDALWNLRMLFAWAEQAKEQGDGQLRWIGTDFVEALKAKIEERIRES